MIWDEGAILIIPSIRSKEKEEHMNLRMTIQIWEKGPWYIAKCPELDFVSQGKTPEEAKRNLLEVIEIQFEEMKEMGTTNDYLEECGYKFENGDAIPMSELIGFQKQAVEIRA
jgi:predicted RNase H-like HicB family nuclease